MQIPTDAEQLLSRLKESISERASSRSALHFVDLPPSTADGDGVSDPIMAAQAKLMAAAEAFGTLPPSPPTLRARLGLAAVGVIHRLVWWQTNVSRRFAMSVTEFVGMQMEEIRRRDQALADIEQRLHALETEVHDLRRGHKH